MKIFLALLLTCLTAAAARHPFGGAQMLTTARRDRLAYNQPTADKVSLAAVVPFYSRTVEFDIAEPVNALGVIESINLIDWHVVYEDAPHLWIGLGHKRITFMTPNWNAYWRAFVRNEDAPR